MPTPLPQAKAKDLAQQIPSRQLHFRSLGNALHHVRDGLAYVKDALQRWDDSEWPAVEDTVARELSSATMFLAGSLDGMVILEATLVGLEPDARMSFERTPFSSMVLRSIQEDTKSARSSAHSNQPLFADFWTLANFWKHYFPYQPRPSTFESSDGSVRDFCVAIGGGCSTGPIMRDLLVPTFNRACCIMRAIARMPGVLEPFELQDL